MARQRFWTPMVNSQNVLAGLMTVSQNLLINSPLTGSNSSCTVVRTLGQVIVRGDAAFPLVQGSFVIVLGVFNDSVGLGSVPDPASEPYDWLWWKGSIYPGQSYLRSSPPEYLHVLELETRAMRKMRANSTVIFVVRNLSGIELDFEFNVRTLCLLP